MCFLRSTAHASDQRQDVTKNGPRTHKATNVGPTPFHNISFILKNRAPAGTTVSGELK